MLMSFLSKKRKISNINLALSISAKPGMGKTSSMAYIAVGWATDKLRGKPFPHLSNNKRRIFFLNRLKYQKPNWID